MKQALCVVAIGLFLLIGSFTVYALQTQNATPPGEALDSATEATTPVLMRGLFAVEMTSTGIGTIYIQRSENNSTNWVTVKTITNTSAGDQRVYIYENFGDARPGDNSPGAWYKAYLETLTSGSFRVRLAR